MSAIVRYDIAAVPVWYQVRMGWITPMGRILHDASRRLHRSLTKATDAFRSVTAKLESMRPQIEYLHLVIAREQSQRQDEVRLMPYLTWLDQEYPEIAARVHADIEELRNDHTPE